MQRFIFIGLLCLLLSACDKKEEPDDGLYVPQTNMTQKQIIDLLERAIEATISSNQISYTRRDTNDRFVEYPTMEYVYSLNKQAQRSLSVSHENSDMWFFFVDDYNEYGNHLPLSNKLYKNKLPDLYWSHYTSRHKQDFELEPDKYTWTVKEKYFIGKHEAIIPDYYFGEVVGSINITEVLKITLTKDLKINDYYSYGQSKYEDGRTFSFQSKCTCTYTANPMMPQGYDISDFTSVSQHEVKIIWEDSKENIFYSYFNEIEVCVFTPSMVTSYIKPPSGKTLQFFYDANYTQPVETQEILSDVIFYAKWVDL